MTNCATLKEIKMHNLGIDRIEIVGSFCQLDPQGCRSSVSNLEQVQAYRKCGGSTALFFLTSEPGTGARPSLEKMWRER